MPEKNDVQNECYREKQSWNYDKMSFSMDKEKMLSIESKLKI